MSGLFIYAMISGLFIGVAGRSIQEQFGAPAWVGLSAAILVSLANITAVQSLIK